MSAECEARRADARDPNGRERGSGRSTLSLWFWGALFRARYLPGYLCLEIFQVLVGLRFVSAGFIKATCTCIPHDFLSPSGVPVRRSGTPSRCRGPACRTANRCVAHWLKPLRLQQLKCHQGTVLIDSRPRLCGSAISVSDHTLDALSITYEITSCRRFLRDRLIDRSPNPCCMTSRSE